MIRKILSLGFASLILFANMSFGVTTHYCHGKAMSVRLLLSHQGDSCGMNQQESETSCNQAKVVFGSKSCCKNTYSSIQSQNDFKKIVSQWDIRSVVFINFVNKSLIRFTNLSLVFEDYSSLFKQSFQVLYQTFLI